MIDIDRQTLGDLEGAGHLEWLETDGLGGWAGSTLSGALSRRHHHLLRLPTPQGDGIASRAQTGSAAAQPGSAVQSSAAAQPGTVALAGNAGRSVALPNGAGSTATLAESAVDSVALAKLDELVIAKGLIHELGCNRFPFVRSFPGLRHLAAFQRDIFPVWEYEVGDIRLRKTLLLAHGEHTLVAWYEVLAAPAPFVLALRPFFAVRAGHSLGRADLPGAVPEMTHRQDRLTLRWATGEEIHLEARASGFEPRGDWWYRFELEEERRRGLDFQEDLWTPGLLHRQLAPGDRFGLVISAAEPAGREPGDLLEQERRRRGDLLGRLPVEDDLTRILALAGDQFVLRGAGGLPSVAAGYPDCGEATADALIALPGLLLATGRDAEAKRLLRGLARAVSAGALPDRLPGAEHRRESLDASLWFAVALHRYWQATGDDALVRDALLPALAKIVAGHEKGVPSGLRAAGDGLLESAPDSPAAARRPGKAAEINALWVNALATLAEHGTRLGSAEAKSWAERARRIQRRYAEAFWNVADGCLFDSVMPAPADENGGAGGERRDPTLAAHQVLAIGLPFPALSKARGQRLLATLEERLYTPVGLRDRAVPAGGPGSTAGAGTPVGAATVPGRHDLAWPWLLGPFLSALLWLRGAAGRRQALQHLTELDPQLASGVVGTIAELAVTAPPFPPAGHLAHAASVGELLRVYVAEILAAPAPPRTKPPHTPLKKSTKPKAAPAASRSRGREGGKQPAPKAKP